jgi:hypothetical protein
MKMKKMNNETRYFKMFNTLIINNMSRIIIGINCYNECINLQNTKLYKDKSYITELYSE